MQLRKSELQAMERPEGRYSLLAWTEGNYARTRGISQEGNPYQSDAAMARAWSEGWLSSERMSLPRAER
jgi:ferric-dicitrate binding protein FerR (iron transport regulator)